MNDILEYKKLNFLHLNPQFKQKKEIKFIYCYNFRFNGDEMPALNEELQHYLKDVNNFIRKANKRLMGHEMDNIKATRAIKYEIFNREKSENSAFFNLKEVSGLEISNLHSFLISTGYRKKLDKYGFFYEGCLNDQKVFIGGKSQLIVHYCKNFKDVPVCLKIRESASKNYIDKKLGFYSDEGSIDTAVDDFTKFFDGK